MPRLLIHAPINELDALDNECQGRHPIQPHVVQRR